MTKQAIEDNIKFTTRRDEGYDVVRGQITITAEYRISDLAPHRELLKGAAEEEVKKMILHELYGDLGRASQLAFELQCIGCFGSNSKVELLADQLSDILSKFTKA